MKNPVIPSFLALVAFAMTCVAQPLAVNCIQRKNADWHDATSWGTNMVPSDNNEMVIINGGTSAFVDQPFEAPIRVQVGNGVSEPPDGTLTINADFRVKSLAVGVHTETSGRVEQNSGNVVVEELNLASVVPEVVIATYDLNGGKVEADTFKAGIAGPAIFNLQGAGEVVTIGNRLTIGSRSTLRFVGGSSGFPMVNASAADITVEAGATLTVEVTGDGMRPGKFTLIQADQPLAAKFKVELVGVAAGKASLLESEPGVVLEVK